MNLRTMDIPSSSTGRMWHVEELPDTRHGGTYVFCPCPAWKFKGQDCKHTIQAKAQWKASYTGGSWVTPSLVTPTTPDHVAMALDPHKHGDCGLPAGHTSADHDAAVALGVA